MPRYPTFVELAERAGLVLTPGRREFCRVAFDGEALGSSPEAERLWGPSALRSSVGAQPWRDVLLVAGRASGKTTAAALRCVQLAATFDLRHVSRRDNLRCVIVAPKLETARDTLRIARKFAQGLLGSAVIRSTADEFWIRRAGGYTVSVAAVAASSGGDSLRGFDIPCAVFEEAAQFGDDGYAVSDIELWRAASPRMTRDGQRIIISTPYGEFGLIHSLWSRSPHNGHVLSSADVLVGHAPTTLFDPEREAEVAREMAFDAYNAKREWLAEFLSSDAHTFFDAEAVRRAVSAKPLVRGVGFRCAAGADMGLVRNSSALVIAQRARDGSIEVLAVEERRPEPKKPLEPAAVAADFAQVLTAHGLSSVMSDAHYAEAIRPVLSRLKPKAIALESAPDKGESYSELRALLLGGKIRLPAHEKLIRQLKEVTAKPTAGGRLSFDSPTWRSGEHGDLVSALVLAVWQLSRVDWGFSGATIGPSERRGLA